MDHVRTLGGRAKGTAVRRLGGDPLPEPDGSYREFWTWCANLAQPERYPYCPLPSCTEDLRSQGRDGSVTVDFPYGPEASVKRRDPGHHVPATAFIAVRHRAC